MTTFRIKIQNKKKLDKIINLLTNIGIKMSESQNQIDALTLQVTKVFDEITALKSKLEAAIIELEAQIAQGITVDLTALKAAVQTIDDINPDVVI